MIGDTTILVYPRTGTTLNSSRIKVPSYGAAVSLGANVQPKALSEAKAKELGLSTSQSGALVAYAVDPQAVVQVGAKASVAGASYDVAGVSRWASHHVEAILVPMQGGQS